MRPNAHNLAMRDPALASALGALPGADYGSERGRASFGAGFGFSPYDPSRNIGFGYDYGFGVDAAAPPPMALTPMPPLQPHMAPHPALAAMGAHGPHGHHPARAQAAWLQHFNNYFTHHARPPFWDGLYGYYGHGLPQGPHAGMGPEVWAAEHAITAARARLLDPNEHSRLKIERYSFSMSPEVNFVLGTPVAFEATLQPNTRIRAQRVVMNAPVMNFVLIDSLQVANVNVLVGTTEDAYTYNANGQGVMLDLPTLDPANRATVSGSYTGLLPPGYASEFSYQFIVTFQGPSTIVGGL
jgi:hypothetical protein